MARKIDYTKLSDDDLQYISDRQWLIAEGDYLGHETSAAVAAWRNGETSESADDDETIEYKDGTVDQLKAELAERGLETSGKKAELIARLEADDEAKAAAADADENEAEEDDIPEE